MDLYSIKLVKKQHSSPAVTDMHNQDKVEIFEKVTLNAKKGQAVG
jgi:hypothetical protein